MGREGEEHGVDYYFVSRSEFISAKQRNEFIETAEFSGNMYGTSRMAVKKVQEQGKICILDIEVEGVKQVKLTPELDPHYVFVQPPNVEALEKRLRARNTETEQSLKRRLERAAVELAYGASPGNFDIVIVNDDVEVASKKLRDFMIPHIERLQNMKRI